MKRRAQPWLGTLVEITIADSIGDEECNRPFSNAFASIALVHRLMSFHDPASDVSRINYAPVGQVIDVHASTYEVLRTASSISLATNGIFDVNCASKLAEWGYLPRLECESPTYCPGGHILDLLGGQRVKKTGIGWVDLGGIAKGYAVDLAIAALRDAGIRSACVNAGGDLRTFGEVTYQVAIRCPERPMEIGLQTQVREGALATSATYFSRRTVDDLECSAIINGSNGQPVTNGFSVSVRAPTCMIADALTKLVLATANPNHAVLQQFGASAFII
jgi:thiamine biosynthesis lipoprotein